MYPEEVNPETEATQAIKLRCK